MSRNLPSVTEKKAAEAGAGVSTSPGKGGSLRVCVRAGSAHAANVHLYVPECVNNPENLRILIKTKIAH